MSTKVRVGLVGYYGFGNYGDELFRVVLRQRLSEVDFIQLHDIDEKGGLDTGVIAARLEGVDKILIGGGDLVIPYARSSLYWRPEFLTKPVYVYGVGVPRWGGYDPEVVAELREFMQHDQVRGITARDEESAQWIKQHLKPKIPVHCAPDIVCAYRSPAVLRRVDTVGLVLRKQGNQLPSQVVIALVDKILKAGCLPRLLVLGTQGTARHDLAAINELPLGDCDIVLRSDLDEMSRELVSCERVLSMKFHGCLVALTHGVPCIALSSANKFKNFYSDMGVPEWVSSLTDEALPAKFEQILGVSRFPFDEKVRERAVSALETLQCELIR